MSRYHFCRLFGSATRGPLSWNTYTTSGFPRYTSCSWTPGCPQPDWRKMRFYLHSAPFPGFPGCLRCLSQGIPEVCCREGAAGATVAAKLPMPPKQPTVPPALKKAIEMHDIHIARLLPSHGFQGSQASGDSHDPGKRPARYGVPSSSP